LGLQPLFQQSRPEENWKTVDGYIGLNSNPTFTGGQPAKWNFSTNNVGAPRTYNAVAVLVHEITEVMGRVSGLGQLDNQDGGIGEYSILDLFRYTTNSAGQVVPTLTPGPGNFSFDGRTLLTAYNDPTVPPPGDAADWASSVQNDDFGIGGNANFLGAIDIKEMDVIGYDLAIQNVSTALEIYSLDSGVGPAGNYLGPNQALRLSVSDAAANVSQNLDALQPAVKNEEISSITLTDTNPCTLRASSLRAMRRSLASSRGRAPSKDRCHIPYRSVCRTRRT
jgi:hypothetical protein